MKYKCPCGEVLDSEEMTKLGPEKAINQLFDHFEHHYEHGVWK